MIAALELTALAKLMEPLTAESSVTIVVAAPVLISRPVEFAMEAVEPWSRADENAAHEISRGVIPVRRAGVGVIPIVAIRTARRRTHVNRSRNVCRANSDADADSNLGVSGRRRHAGKNHEKPE
jgi:hypothetical protein